MSAKLLLIGSLSNDGSQPNGIRPQWAAADTAWLASLMPPSHVGMLWRNPAGGAPPVSFAHWLTLSQAQRDAIKQVTRDWLKTASQPAGVYVGINQGFTPPDQLDAIGESPNASNRQHWLWWEQSIIPWVREVGCTRVCFDACPQQYYAPLLTFCAGRNSTPRCELWVEPVFPDTPTHIRGMCTWNWLHIHPIGRTVVAPFAADWHCVLTAGEATPEVIAEVEARGFVASYRNTVWA